MQTSSVADLARRYGDTEPETIIEWGVSGAARTGAFGGTGRGGRRRAFLDLRERVDAGTVSAIYAYSLSRLARSTRDLLDLAELCATRSVPIRLAKEGELDFASPHGRLYLTVLAAVATFEAEVAGERARDRTAAARDRGEYIGKPPFGYRIEAGRLVVNADEWATLEAARAAIAETDSDYAAARRLNEAEIPSPTGHKWRDGTIRRIRLRDAGDYTPQDRTVRGSSRRPSAPFSRILSCASCGNRLTPSTKRYHTAAGEPRHFRTYECQGARQDPHHPYPRQVAETVVLEWAMGELAHLALPVDRVTIAEAAEAERHELDARRSRLVDALEHGTLTRADVDDRLADIESKLGELDARARVVDVPTAIEWDAPIPEVQAQLVAILEGVTVDLTGPTFLATWRDETYRSPDRRSAVA